MERRVALARRQVLGPGVELFAFERPEDFSFHAGQYLLLSLETAEGRQTKAFSICSAPHDTRLEIATRMSGSAFKNALGALAPGGEAGIAGPAGRLAVPEGVGEVAFLVGGIGITPVRSIIRDAVHRRAAVPLLLFYGSNEDCCILFREELDTAAEESGRVRVVHCIAKPSADWRGETGFVTAELVRRHVDPDEVGHWISTGPPPMMDAMQKVLAELGVPGERFTFESFAGY